MGTPLCRHARGCAMQTPRSDRPSFRLSWASKPSPRFQSSFAANCCRLLSIGRVPIVARTPGDNQLINALVFTKSERFFFFSTVSVCLCVCVFFFDRWFAGATASCRSTSTYRAARPLRKLCCTACSSCRRRLRGTSPCCCG